MYRFFKRNQKKLLAIFGAFLMVVFILPSTVGSGRNRRANPVIGYIGSQKLHALELGQARADWELLKRIPFRTSQFQQFPWVYYKLGPVALEIDQDPELFLLLQKEAERQGIRVAQDRLEQMLHSELEGRPGEGQDMAERRRSAAEAYLLVQSLVDRVGDNVKVSQPMVDRRIAEVAQEMKLNLVEFRADEFQPAAAAPTTQEVREHFRKYANVPASQPTTAPASLPFGYKYPDRVKLQYLAIRKDQVREAARKGKSDYDWDVAAHRYYLSHPAEFLAAPPPVNPLGPSLASAATAPATQPFEQVKQQVMDKVMQPEIDRLTADVRAAVQKRLAAAWDQHRARPGATSRPATGPASAPATGPATAPAGTQPTGYPSFAFLEQLAADVQKEFGVLPAVTSKADQWLSADDLSKLPGIGTAFTTRDDGRSFANYVVQSAEPFLPVPGKADPSAVLSILEPSEPLEDFERNVYFFRLTDAQPAHAPTDVAEVRQQVEQDVVVGRAYAKAVDEAKKLLEAAKRDGFEKAAAAAGRAVKATGSFGGGRFGPTTIPNYPLETDARQALVAQAQKLLTEATPDKPNPAMVIELPSERKVIVAELAGVTSQLPDQIAYAERLRAARQLASREAQNLTADYFKADAVRSRLAYRSADPEEDKRREEEKRKRDAERALLQ